MDFNIFLAFGIALPLDVFSGMFKLGCRNFLFSYHYEDEILPKIEKTILKEERVNEVKFIIDSGAYSAWNSGAEIDIDKYIGFCKRLQDSHRDKVKDIFFTNLDVIPASPGVTPTDKQLEDSAMGGLVNADYMRSKGIEPLEVFHEGEDEEILHFLVERTKMNYIGIAPKSISAASIWNWLVKTWEILGRTYPDLRVHGFGITAESVMKKWPWYSVDSTSFIIMQAFARMCYFDSGKICRFRIGDKEGTEIQRQNLRENWQKISLHLPEGYRDIDSMFNIRPYRIVINAWTFFQMEKFIRETRTEKKYTYQLPFPTGD